MTSSDRGGGHNRLSALRSEHLGRAIKEARRQRGLTQDALAAKSGLTPEHLRAIERGAATNPTLATVYAIADALRITAQSILPD